MNKQTSILAAASIFRRVGLGPPILYGGASPTLQLATASILLSIVCTSLPTLAQEAADQPKAKQILDATGVKGGLVVHIGCGQGRLTAALRGNERYLVHGLDTEAKNVQAATDYLRSLGVYGKVSVERLADERLPYVDNLVNLVVSENLGKVSIEEVMRVLVPGGVAYISHRSEVGGLKTEDRSPTSDLRPPTSVFQWTKTVKPRPDGIDEWSHFLHDASNNAVAHDVQVGPPRCLKWVCGPLWSRSHEFISSLCAMVSSEGRLFYVFDEGLTGVTPESIPEKWVLIARDAFNGTLLWKRPLPEWGSRQWKTRALRNAPETIPRRIVAQDDRLFITLGDDGGVSVLDAATGEIVTTLEQTKGTDEIRCCEGVLLLCKGNERIAAIDTATEKQLWDAAAKVRPLTLAACAGKVFYQDGLSLVSRSLKDGNELWRTPIEAPVSLLVAHENRVLLLSKQTLAALAADTGQTLWTIKAGINRNELFVANGQLWHWQGDRIVGRSLETGQVTTRPDTSDVFTEGHHLRCYQSKATENFLITPNRGVEFVSVRGDAHAQSDWVRGPCHYGIMPCNGLLYVAPNPCFCYPGVKLTGFNALAPDPPVRSDAVRRYSRNAPSASSGQALTGTLQTERLEKGPAWHGHPGHDSSTGWKPAPPTKDKGRVTNEWPT